MCAENQNENEMERERNPNGCLATLNHADVECLEVFYVCVGI